MRACNEEPEKWEDSLQLAPALLRPYDAGMSLARRESHHGPSGSRGSRRIAPGVALLLVMLASCAGDGGKIAPGPEAKSRRKIDAKEKFLSTELREVGEGFQRMRDFAWFCHGNAPDFFRDSWPRDPERFRNEFQSLAKGLYRITLGASHALGAPTTRALGTFLQDLKRDTCRGLVPAEVGQGMLDESLCASLVQVRMSVAVRDDKLGCDPCWQLAIDEEKRRRFEFAKQETGVVVPFPRKILPAFFGLFEKRFDLLISAGLEEALVPKALDDDELVHDWSDFLGSFATLIKAGCGFHDLESYVDGYHAYLEARLSSLKQEPATCAQGPNTSEKHATWWSELGE